MDAGDVQLRVTADMSQLEEVMERAAIVLRETEVALLRLQRAAVATSDCLKRCPICGEIEPVDERAPRK